MSAIGRKVLDLAEQQGLLDGKAIAELRKQVAESKFVITPEAIAKVLVDNGHLTPFQARKLVSQALGAEPSFHERAPPKKPVEDLTFADEKAARKAASARPTPASPSLPVPAAKPAKPKPIAPVAKEPAVPQPVDGSTADDFVELEPIDPTPQARGSRWRTDAPETPLAETIELSPLEMGQLNRDPLASDPLDPSGPPVLEPISETVALDDVLGPELSPAATPAARGMGGMWERPAAPMKRAGKNPWDSPLLLVGGAVLGVTLVAFALLLYALTRGSAAEMFSKAEDEYQSGSYGTALAIYDQFLKRYPNNPSASLARVRHGMAQLRQVSDDGNSPRVALTTAQQVLPQIETEEKFGEARSELATILPDIADGLATEAAQADDSAGKQQLVKLASDALTLVNNPSYLPASLRKERETRIARIIDKLQGAERGIQQNKDLVAAIEAIANHAKAGNAAAAYGVRSELLQKYPALENSQELVAAIRSVGDKERELVAVKAEQVPAETSDHPPASQRVILSHREGPAGPAGTVQPAFILVEGAVYGIDPASGRVLWRRFVGYQTTAQPLELEDGGKRDAVVLDGQRQELLRLKGTSGDLVWRQAIKQAAAAPILSGGKIVVTTRSGQILAIDAGTGAIVRTASLPQGAVVSAASDVRPGTSSQSPKLYQLGEHSTLFVLDAGSLACVETAYTGHKAGLVLVPPLAVLGQVLVVESPADDQSTIRVLATDEKSQRLKGVGRTFTLKGRVVQPLAVSRNRVAAVTDLGQVAVYEVDPSNAQEPVRQIANLNVTENSPQPVYCVLEGSRLWVTHRRRMLYEIQVTLQQLTRRWSENHDDVFIAPPQLQGDKLIQVRRREGAASVLVEGCQASDGQPVWMTRVAAPIVALAASPSRKAVDILTQEGRLYSLNTESAKPAVVESPSFSPRGNSTMILPAATVAQDGHTLVWTEASQSSAKASGRAFIYDVVSGKTPRSISLPGEPVAPAQGFAGGVLAPMGNGSVALVPLEGGAAVSPFTPPLSPGELPRWTKPAVLASSFVVSDGRDMIYAVVKKDQPQPHLASAGEKRTSGPVVSSLVVAGGTAFGVIRLENADALAAFDGQGAAVFEPVALEGRVDAGPYAIGGLVLVATEPGGLVCAEANGKIRWQRPLEEGPLAGPPLATAGGELLVLYQSGAVCRLDATSGESIARVAMDEPLGGAACIVGEQVFAATSDGAVLCFPLPARP